MDPKIKPNTAQMQHLKVFKRFYFSTNKSPDQKPKGGNEKAPITIPIKEALTARFPPPLSLQKIIAIINLI